MLNNLNSQPLQSRQRLNKISHHFLGDSPAASCSRQAPFFLPILVDDENHKKLVLKLNDELIKKGHSSCIVNTSDIYDNLKNSGFLPGNEDWSNPFGDINDHNIRNYAYNITRKHILNKQKEDIYLLPYTFSQSFVPVLFGKAVMIIASTLDEIRSAYGDIKNLNKYAVKSIDIIMTYADNPDIASRYFSKLDDGVKKFLQFNIHNAGYIKTDKHSPADDGIEKITSTIINRWQSTKKQPRHTQTTGNQTEQIE